MVFLLKYVVFECLYSPKATGGRGGPTSKANGGVEGEDAAAFGQGPRSPVGSRGVREPLAISLGKPRILIGNCLICP